MTTSPYLTGSLLLAMPGMTDPRFDHAVIYLCSHDESGAMGLIINYPLEELTFASLMEQLDVPVGGDAPDVPIHSGGPVEPGRGFVLHSADYVQESTLIVSQTLALSATVDILAAIAESEGPRNHLLALGYTGWGPGQLEQEIQQNAWLTAEADEEIIFHTELYQKWPRTMAMLGIDAAMLSVEAGHA